MAWLCEDKSHIRDEHSKQHARAREGDAAGVGSVDVADVYGLAPLTP